MYVIVFGNIKQIFLATVFLFNFDSSSFKKQWMTEMTQKNEKQINISSEILSLRETGTVSEKEPKFGKIQQKCKHQILHTIPWIMRSCKRKQNVLSD